MKANLEFNLPEEQEDFDTCCNARKYYCVLWDLDQELRSKIKYDEKLNDEQYKIYEEIREKLHELLNEQNISFY